MSPERLSYLLENREKILDTGPLVGIIMGSKKDLSVMIEAVYVLERLRVPYSVDDASVHRNLGKVVAYAHAADKLGLHAIIVGAGKAAGLPGVLAGLTLIPPIFVPISGEKFKGLDAFYAGFQMPTGTPVGVMITVDSAYNAGCYAAQMLATNDPELRQRLTDFRAERNTMDQDINKFLQQVERLEFLRHITLEQ